MNGTEARVLSTEGAPGRFGADAAYRLRPVCFQSRSSGAFTRPRRCVCQRS